MPVLAAIAVLALLIVVHELGHFMAARFQGIHVNRFSIGFGPILWKYQGPQTEYAIRAFPLGGFVGFPDDDPDSNIPENDPNLLRNRPILDRAIVISAGVIANLIFAYFLLVSYVGTVGFPEAQPGVAVAQVTSQLSVAAKAGIQPKDIVLIANGRELGTSEAAVKSFQEIIKTHPNQKLPLVIQRGTQQLSLEVTPEKDSEGQGRIGVMLKPNDEQPGVSIEQLTPELSFAAKTDLKAGDVILAADGQKLGIDRAGYEELKTIVQSHADRSLPLLIQRGTKQLSIQATPELEPIKNMVVLQLAPHQERRRASNIVEAFSMGAAEFERITVLTAKGFAQLITNFNDTINQVAGPVKIVEEGAKVAEKGSLNLFWFGALVSINLALINILPLPALDGGQLAFLFVEWLRGKPLPTHIQDGVMQTGLVLLLGLGIFLIVRDTSQLPAIQRLLQ